MRTFLIATVCLVAAAIAFLLLDAGAPRGPEAERRDVDVAGERAAGAEAPIAEPVDDGAVARRAKATAPEPPATEAAPAAERCVVIATVVDGSGAPIEGAVAQLAAYGKWDDAGAGEDLEGFGMARDAGRRGFETETDTAGRLRFDVPVPTIDGASLYVAGGVFQDAATFSFSDRSDRSLPMLGPGVRDLGEIRLIATGAIRGRVTDEIGAPIADARVSLDAGQSGMPQRHARTDANGDYLMGHVPAAVHGVEADHADFLASLRPSVRVEVGRETVGIDLTLTRAPRISGRVVDERGSPVADARLSGWAKSWGRGLAARTEEDGTFDVALPQDEPYTLQVTHPDFEKWGDMDDKSVLYEQGTTGIEVTLTRVEKARFLVVADETGEPLERFGLRVYRGTKERPGGGYERQIPSIDEHADGIVLLQAHETVDHVLVWAPDRVITEQAVTWEDGASRAMTIRLARGATVTGRLVDGGVPVQDAPVEVVASNSFGRDREATQRRAVTGADGRFSIHGVGPGLHRFAASPTGRAEVALDGVQATPPETVDLGDVEVPEAGAIEGVVRVPAGVDPEGLEVIRGDWKDGIAVKTDPSGHFRFEAVAPGIEFVTVHPRPGVLDESKPVYCEVKAGETTEVEIDVTDRVVVPVELRIELGSALSVDGLSVILKPRDPGLEVRNGPRIEADGNLGKLNASGIASGHVRALGECELQISSMELGVVTHPSARIVIQPGQPVAETVRFEFADAKILLPDAPELPEAGWLIAEVRTAEGDRRYLRTAIGGSALAPSPTMALNGRALTLRALLPGEFTLTAWAEAKDAPWVETTFPDGRTGTERESLWKFSGTATLVAGETAEVALD